jgi:hypothetical protein
MKFVLHWHAVSNNSQWEGDVRRTADHAGSKIDNYSGNDQLLPIMRTNRG